MNARNVALAIAGVVVGAQFLSSQTIVAIPPAAQLAVALVTVLGAFSLLHLPGVGGYVVGQDAPTAADAAPVTPAELQQLAVDLAEATRTMPVAPAPTSPTSTYTLPTAPATSPVQTAAPAAPVG